MAIGILESVDRQLDVFFSGWNTASTILAVLCLAVLFYPLFFGTQADTHPFLLARQGHASTVRQSGESAVYRAPEIPHGYPLRSGLNVKDEGTPAWAPGKDGDLRYIWREATKEKDGKIGKVLSIKGKDQPVTHELADMTKAINIVGTHIQEKGGKRVAICLPNSVEFLEALFAATFYGFPAILVPLGQSHEFLVQVLRDTKADLLIALAGTVPQDIQASHSGLKHIIWIVERTSRQVDWLSEPGAENASEWHKLIDEQKERTSASVPEIIPELVPPGIATVWQKKKADDYEIVEFSQKNLAAAVAAQLYALPSSHRLESRDLVLSLSPLTLTFPLTVTLAALYSHASVALTSVAGSAPDYSLAFQSAQPTVVIASTETVAHAHARNREANQGLFRTLDRSRQARALAAGAMPRANDLVRGAAAGPRLLYASERAGADSVPLSATELTDLRVWTGARVVYALTAARIAGAVAQTNMLDYRMDEGQGQQRSHFGPPLSCVEVKTVEAAGKKIPDEGEEEHVGEVTVVGPAVVGGEAKTGVMGAFATDHTLVLK